MSPGVLNRRSVFDPRFQRGMAFVDEKADTSSVLVRRRTAASIAPWDFDTGGRPDDGDYKILWTGPARVQPNKDWRARGYVFGDETVVFQACRFRLPLANGVWADDIDDADKFFLDEDQVIITETSFKNLERLKRYIFVVRNPLISGNGFQQNLLADVNLKSGLSVGNP